MGAKIAVVGGGAWGTALAAHAARHDHDTTLWAREEDVVRDINQRHENRLFLEGVHLPKSLKASLDMAEAVKDADFVILVPPSAFLGRVAASLAPHLPEKARVVIATKGIEIDSLRLMNEVAAEAMPGAKLTVLSGPSFAKEVASGLPTDVVVAGTDDADTKAVADTLHSPTFRIYTSRDPVGVEVGGAIKNVLAIAAGVCDGLGMGMNARAALVTRGLSEMARLGVALGGDPLTFLGLSGVGDLILTTTGALSRNRQLGLKLAEGLKATEWLATQRTVAEGFLTAKAAHQLAQKLGIEMPLVEQGYWVMHEGKDLLEAMKSLLTREKKSELWGFRL